MRVGGIAACFAEFLDPFDQRADGGVFFYRRWSVVVDRRKFWDIIGRNGRRRRRDDWLGDHFLHFRCRVRLGKATIVNPEPFKQISGRW